jgi:plasmid stability protein
MAGLLIKDFPPELHRRLKEEATRYHRSMTRQALALLEQALSPPTRDAADLLPQPLKPKKSVTPSDVVAVIREGRESGKTRRSK